MTERPEDTVIETERLWLRQWRSDDAERFRHLPTDPVMMRFIGTGEIWPDDEIAFFINREKERFAAHGFCLWPVIHKDSGELMGLCGLKHLADTGMIEVGWWIAEAYWGQGLGTEAGRAAVKAGFEQFELERVVAIAQPENGASVRIMEKVGMTFVRNMEPGEIGKDRGGPVVLYEVFPPGDSTDG